MTKREAIKKTSEKCLKFAISWAKDEQSWLMIKFIDESWWMTEEYLFYQAQFDPCFDSGEEKLISEHWNISTYRWQYT